MKWSEIAARINGISTPVGGISWVPPVLDSQTARRVIAFVEVRRVLFSTYTNEVPEQCALSVIEIRNFLTEIIGAGGIGDELMIPIRRMRGYCLRFLERVGMSERDVPPEGQTRHLRGEPRWHMHDYFFGEALGELRAGVGFQAGVIASRYNIDMEDDLASVIPSA